MKTDDRREVTVTNGYAGNDIYEPAYFDTMVSAQVYVKTLLTRLQSQGYNVVSNHNLTLTQAELNGKYLTVSIWKL